MSIYIDSTTGRINDTTVRRPRARAASHNGRMTWTRLFGMVQAGYGQGHGEDYQPWNMVGKHDYSPISNVGHQPAPEYGHVHHPRSRNQRKLFDLLAWLGASDVRDHFPVWPWAHEHPATGLAGARNLPRQPGLLEVAEEASLGHRTYIGTDIPRPYTFNCLSTWEISEGKSELVAFQLAPPHADAAVRFTDYHCKLVLLSRYCECCEIPFKIVDLSKVPDQLFVNLDAIRPRLDAEERAEMKCTAPFAALLSVFRQDRCATPASDLLQALASNFELPSSYWRQALHLALWDQDLDHDLSLPLEMWEPLKPGGLRLRDTVRAMLF